MGPILILDKSTLQSLSSDELIFLNKYFIINIPPILIMEIWADLAKSYKGGEISQEKVQLLAQKIYRGMSAINANYFQCLLGSLLGEKVPMEGRILLQGGSPRISNSGKKGIIFEETSEQKQLNRWKEGDFDTEEQSIAAQWRAANQDIDFEALKSKFTKQFKSILNIDNLDDLDSFLEKFFAYDSQHTGLLAELINEYKIPQMYASRIFLRYEQAKAPNLCVFAPYAYFCFKIKRFFLIALIYNLVSTRKTNIIDLEYLYYLPFCMAFTSSDKFHQTLIHYFIRDDQRFISGENLKKDLTNFVCEWEEIFNKNMKAWDEKYGDGPPENNDSVIYKLWKDLLPKWKPGKKNKNMRNKNDTEKTKNIIEQINEFDKSEVSEDTDFQSDEPKFDFIIRKYRISIDDPCPCGSGKKYKDCHLPEVRNNEKPSQNQ